MGTADMFAGILLNALESTSCSMPCIVSVSHMSEQCLTVVVWLHYSYLLSRLLYDW